MTSTHKQATREIAIVATSGLNFPTKSRKYLIDMVRDAAVKAGAKFVIIAGNTLDGKALETEFKARLKEKIRAYLETTDAKDRRDDPTWRIRLAEEFTADFVEEYASQLDDYLPLIPGGVNWHIVIAEKVFDKAIGARILEQLQERRDDVRLIGARQDGSYDTEPKVPVQFRGFDTIRVIVPHRTPWFYRIVTSFMQRLIDSFVPRTSSERPSMMLVGCTGTAAHLPFYEGVPCISVPTLHKIDVQLSAENMVGCSVIRVIEENGRTRVIAGTHDFRSAIYAERDVVVPAGVSLVQRAVLHALIKSDASLKGIRFWVNENRRRFGRKREITDAKIEKALDSLKKRELVWHSSQSNRYALNEHALYGAEVTLDALHAGSRDIKHLGWSCFHGGSSKTLYFTALEEIPRLAEDVDAIIENGDINQGISHNYEYNGELAPWANGADKQEKFNAHFRAKLLAETFCRRWARNEHMTDDRARLEASVVRYVFGPGNHDTWLFYGKRALPLSIFEDNLRVNVASMIYAACVKFGLTITADEVRAITDERIVRVGESRMVHIDGITVGIKHPYKGGARSRSARIQEVAEFIWRRFERFSATVAKKSDGFAMVYVANFHTAAAVHIGKFGRTIVGVMTGAYLHDTEFESNIDKVVEYGPVVVRVTLNKEGRVLYTETEFSDYINAQDSAFVLADRLDTHQVLEHGVRLFDRIKMKLPWR
jgi:hypothetical protein